MINDNDYSYWEVDNGGFPPGWTQRMMRASHEADPNYIGFQYSVDGVTITVMRMNGKYEYDEEGVLISVPTKHLCRAKVKKELITADLLANAVVAQFAALDPPIQITANAVKQKQTFIVFDGEAAFKQHLYDNAEEYGETVI